MCRDERILHVAGDLTVSDCIAMHGGGVYTYLNATLVVNGTSTFLRNTAYFGEPMEFEGVEGGDLYASGAVYLNDIVVFDHLAYAPFNDTLGYTSGGGI